MPFSQKNQVRSKNLILKKRKLNSQASASWVSGSDRLLITVSDSRLSSTWSAVKFFGRYRRKANATRPPILWDLVLGNKWIFRKSWELTKNYILRRQYMLIRKALVIIIIQDGFGWVEGRGELERRCWRDHSRAMRVTQGILCPESNQSWSLRAENTLGRSWLYI